MKRKYTLIESFPGIGPEILFPAGTKALFLIAFCILLFMTNGRAQVCCPQFRLQDAVEICPPDGACPGGSAIGGPRQHGFVACRLIQHQYTVYPNDPSFTYTWTITGGTPASATGNPVNITWGNGSQGFIKVVISNIANGGSCKDSLLQEICLIPGPKANFTLGSDTVCVNSPVTFTNTSSGGSTYLWDFGDGTTSDLATPPAHSYALPGTYTVTLTATNSGPVQQGAGTDVKPPCGCTDRISKTVVVLNGSGPSIDLSCCYGTVCPGDTSSFCTSVNCTTYNWSVAGGTIISGAGTNCIKVKWNAVYTVPTTVTLAVPGCGNAPCGGSTTLPVPVLYPNLPISGPNVLCVGESGSYFLPTMPGTYYLWTTTAPPTDYAFNDQNKNTPNVNIVYSQPGTYVLQCQYQNPMAGCNGVSTLVIDVRPVFSISGDETVCEGSSVTYSVTSGTATWSATPAGATVPPGPSNTSTVTWNTPGTYTLSATTTTSGVFCNQTAIKVVKVIAKPVLGSITGPSPVCPNKNYTFAVTSNVSGSPFVWSATNGTVMSEMGADKDSAVIKLNFPGSWTISVFQKIEISPGVFCQSLPQTLTVNSFGPPTITGNGNVCVDAVETYTASGPVPPGGFQWAVIPPSQGSIITPNGGSSVNIKWHGTPNTAVVTVTTCGGTGTKNVTVLNPPFVAPITLNGPDGYCYPNLPNNLVLSTTTGYPSYQWFYNNNPVGTNSASYSVPNGTFTGMGSYLFTVAVSNGTCSVLRYVIVHVDSCAGGGGGTPTPFNCTVDFTMNPNPACVNEPVTFTAIGSPGFSYAWSFGDGYTSFQSPTQHEYANAGTDTVTLVATYGTCVVTKKKVITVNPKPFCFITASDTVFCPGSSVTLTACNGMNSYQWYRNGILLPNDTNQTCNAGVHGEYEVEVTNGYGCRSRSNSLYIYMNSLPKADITGEGSVCSNANAFAGFQLNAFYDPKYKYDWSSNAGGATFTPNNSNAAASTFVGLTLPGTLPVTYFFVVKVTDTVTTCEARDTLCITFYETPPLNISYTAQCEGSPVTFAAIPANPSLYNYTWSSGQTTPSITVSAAGAYSVTVTDKLNGCSISSPAGVIYPLPDLRLFPLGCDSILCNTDTIQMYIPLPLNWQPPNNVYPNAYNSITWYDNGNYGTPIAYGQSFPFAANAGGSHQLSVVVQTNHGCSDTAGVYCITVLCGDLEFAHCPSAPIVLPCNSTAPTVADALAAAGPATSTCPGPVNLTVSGGTPISIGGCTWLATFTLTATDACGGILVCNVTFKWKEDHEPPFFSSCPSGAVTLPCNAPHPTTADALALVGPVMDNCPGVVNTVVTGGIPTPTSGCYWTATFTVTATDACGNTAVCYVVFNWKEDLVPPQFAHCPSQPITLPCNVMPNQEELLYEIGAVTDNCPGTITVQVSGGVPTPTTGCNWTATYTVTATDSCGNTNVCSVTYNWKMDNQPPQFAHCPAGPISLPCNAPHPTESDALSAAGTISDNCPGTIVQVTGGVPLQTTGCNWTSTFVIQASDSCGNTATCSVTYNWKEDLVPPQFAHCPSQPITLPCNVMPNQEELLYEIGPITDNCQAQVNVQISGGVPTPTTGCNWTTTYTVTATDSCGNVSVCNVTYNWKMDNQPPQFAHCPAGPISLPCNAPRPTESDALSAAGTISDNCPGTIVQVTGGVPVQTTGCNWTSTFVIQASDSCGNTATCSVTYNWKEDLVPPQFAHCPSQPITLPCNVMPNQEELLYEIGPITDNCQAQVNVQISGGVPTPTTGCNWTATYTVTATDSCGNTNVCSVTYNWKMDNQPPQFAHCPAGPISLPCNAAPDSEDAIAAVGAVTDNCGGQISVTSSASATVPLTNCTLSQTFTVTATDDCGNQSQCVVVFHWTEDHLPPVFAHCPVKPITLPCNVHPTETEAILAAGAVTDNCYVDFLQVADGGVVPLSGCWMMQTYTLSATDGCGNTSYCQVTYRWKEDHTAPVFAHCPADTVNLACNAPHPTVAGALAAAGPVSDNCPGVVVIANCLPPVDSHYDSPELVTYSTAYSIRNFSLQSFSDCYPLPTLIGQPETHTYSSTAAFEISSDGGNTWTPVQSPASVTMQITKTDEDPVQSYYSTEILDMNISGTSLPEGVRIRETPAHASTGEVIVQQGSEHYTVSSFFDVFTELSADGGQTWNVAVIPINVHLYGPIIVHVTPGPVTPTTGCGFTQTFSMTATDACGNVGTCAVTYNWKTDHTPPVFAHCPEAPVNLGCNPVRPTPDLALAAVGAVTDNCPGSVFTQIQSGPIMEFGPCGFTQTFTVIATDACGNQAICHVTYQWKEDHVKPTFTRPPDITIYANEFGQYNASVSFTGDVTDEADNCASGLDATFADLISDGVPPVLKVISRNWQLIDPCGNVTLKTQTITVADPNGGKVLTVSVLLEGLYDGLGVLRKVQGDAGDQFGADTADVIRIELHEPLNYAQVTFAADHVKLNTEGVAVTGLPTSLTGNYYLTVRHRNSLETTSSEPVSFAGNAINYSFDIPSRAYGNNLLLMIDGRWVVYGGDLDGDGFVDTNDMSEVDNLSALFEGGYLPQDVNGDGFVDTGDMTILDNNASEFVSVAIP